MISEQGYSAFSLSGLARKIGLTNAGVLHYFGSKEGLLVALLQERDKQDETAVAAMIGLQAQRMPVSRDVCRASLRAIVARNAAQPEMLRLYAMLRAEALVPDHPAARFFRNRETATIELFRQMVANITPDPLSMARHISALMTGLETQWLRESRSFDLMAEWAKALDRILP